jgi:hypothetical protein
VHLGNDLSSRETVSDVRFGSRLTFWPRCRERLYLREGDGRIRREADTAGRIASAVFTRRPSVLNYASRRSAVLSRTGVGRSVDGASVQRPDAAFASTPSLSVASSACASAISGISGAGESRRERARGRRGLAPGGRSIGRVRRARARAQRAARSSGCPVAWRPRRRSRAHPRRARSWLDRARAR